MLPQNIAEKPVNKTSILNNIKSFTKEENDQNNYFRAETSQRKEQLPRIKVKKKKIFNNKENLLLFLKSNFYKNKFANTYMSYVKLAIVFHINTLKLF